MTKAALMMMTSTAKKMMDPPGDRPTMKQQELELEQLRTRGLTKSLAAHFRKEASKVENELACAEAALVELQTRKEKASEFLAPHSAELDQLKQMCERVMEWKKQLRVKEQEFVMLYRRYCERFGSSIELAKPEELVKASKVASGASAVSALANTDVATLFQAFQNATNEYGIPDFLLPSEASSPPSFSSNELEEILEESSLQDADAPCRVLPATPQNNNAMDELDDSSIVSGLTTLNSAVTREVLQDVDQKVLSFIKRETLQIRKLMEEDAMSKAQSMAAASKTSRSDSVAEQIDMVAQMQAVLESFKKAEEEAKLKEEKGTTTLVRRLEGVGTLQEEWYEHWDSTFQRHFYVEAKTNKTQWQMPGSQVHHCKTDASVAETSLSVSMNTLGTLPAMGVSVSSTPTSKQPQYEELVTDFIPEPRTRSSRVEAYRARVKKQRNRQLVMMGVVLAVLGAGALCYKLVYPEQVDHALESVANVVALDGSSSSNSNVDRAAKPKQSKKPKKKTMTDAKVKESTKTEANKKETKTTAPSSSTPSVPVSPTKKTKVPTTATTNTPSDATPSTPQAKKEEAPVKGEGTTIAANNEKEAQVADTPDETMGLATFKPESQHWILDVLIGPLAFKEVNRKCYDRERYCGLHHY